MRTRTLTAILLGVALFSPSALLAQRSAPTSAKNQLTLLTYSDHKSLVLSTAELKAVPHVSATVHNPHTNADEVYPAFACLICSPNWALR